MLKLLVFKVARAEGAEGQPHLDKQESCFFELNGFFTTTCGRDEVGSMVCFDCDVNCWLFRSGDCRTSVVWGKTGLEKERLQKRCIASKAVVQLSQELLASDPVNPVIYLPEGSEWKRTVIFVGISLPLLQYVLCFCHLSFVLVIWVVVFLWFMLSMLSFVVIWVVISLSFLVLAGTASKHVEHN